MTVLSLAQEQLFSRAPEDHFESFLSLQTAAATQRRRCTTLEAPDTSVRFLHDGRHVRFGDQVLRLSHYALSQCASTAKVPMAVLERLDGETRARVLEQTYPREGRDRLALSDGERLRCITSDRYERVWDQEVLAEVDRWLLPSGFVPAKPTINTDAIGTNILGNTKPALFRSDRDMFAFFYSDRSPGDDGFGGLRRGIVVFNSEVGAKSFGFTTMVFREMCGNWLLWDATEVRTRRARHVGVVRSVVRNFREEVRGVAPVLSTAEYDAFERARTARFVPEGPGEREAAVRRLQREFGFSEADALEVTDLVRAPENPGEFTLWGVANGITSAAKGRAYAEGRTALSTVAGRVLAAATA